MKVQRQSSALYWMIAFVLMSVFFAFQPAQSQTIPPETRGPYMIAQADRLTVWRVDQSTGKVSYCIRDSMSTDPNYIKTRRPFCSAWSE